MPRPLGIRPVPVFDEEEKPLTDKSRVAQATINDNFRLLGTRIQRLETFDEENNRPLVYSAAQTAGAGIISGAPPASNTPGTQIGFATENPLAFAIVTATWDFECTVVGYGAAIGALWVTGGPYGAGTDVSSPQAIFQIPAVGYRLTVTQQWTLTCSTPGGYTVDMYARKTINAGNVNTALVHTNQKILVFDSA